ncbi:hypothetical protein ES703_71014 [subsurface metagenome]
MASLPSDFLTPFPHRPPRRLRNSALKKCHFEPDVRTPSFFQQIDPHVLKHTRRPISSASLGGRFEKAKSSRSLLPFPCILPTLEYSSIGKAKIHLEIIKFEERWILEDIWSGKLNGEMSVFQDGLSKSDCFF